MASMGNIVTLNKCKILKVDVIFSVFAFVAKNEAAMLCEEASMPIEKLLERYGGAGCVVNRPINVLKKSGVKKTLSPVIRPKPSLPPLAKSESDQVVDNGCGDGKVSEAEDDTSETASKTDICVKLADKIVNGCYNDVNGDNDQDNVTSENIKNVKNDLSLSEDKSHSTSPDADEVKSDESTLKSSTSDIKEATTNCEGDAKETSTCNSRDVSDEVNKCEKLASVSSTSCSTSVG